VYARVTLLEIDAVRVDVDDAVDRFRTEVLPELQRLDGYRGVYVLTTPEGKALLMTLWATAEAAEAGGSTGFYPETLAAYATMFASPPGRERYEVALTDDARSPTAGP
jgi:heme-degrading monooxygenase HmoA